MEYIARDDVNLNKFVCLCVACLRAPHRQARRQACGMTALTRSMHSITNNIGQASCLTACSTEAGCLVYFNRQLKSKKKVVGFLSFITQPNLFISKTA